MRKGYKFQFLVEGRDSEKAIKLMKKVDSCGLIEQSRVLSGKSKELDSLEGLLTLDSEKEAKATLTKMTNLLIKANIILYNQETKGSYRPVIFYA